MKTYYAKVDSTVAHVNGNGPSYQLDPRLDLCSHSPDGFAWGYQGSGPAQLALAILADYLTGEETGDEQAYAMYQEFKSTRIAGRPQDKPFEISEGEIERWIMNWRRRA